MEIKFFRLRDAHRDRHERVVWGGTYFLDFFGFGSIFPGRFLLFILFEMPIPDEDLNSILKVDVVFHRIPVTFMKPEVLAFVSPWPERCLSGKANHILLEFCVCIVGQNLLA